MEHAENVVVSSNPWSVAAFIFYLTVIIGIGIFTTRFSSAGIGEYFLAGRKLKQFVVALSAVVSGRSSWLLLGVTGMAYTRGVSAVWAVVGYILVELFLFLFLAKRLRRFTERMDNITLPDFFESRFHDHSGLLRIASVTIILIFMISYIAAQFSGGGKAFYSSFGIPVSSGMVLTAAIVLIYTVLGGFLAVSLTDMIQAFFMLIALVVLPIIVIDNHGGYSVMLNSLRALDISLIDPFSLSVGALIGYIGIGLGSPGNPHILVRYMSIDDPRQLRWSALIGTVWNVVMAWGALYIGLIGRAVYSQSSELPGSDSENIFPFLAQTHLHPVLFGMVVAAIFAAIMSTADSQLLVAASGVVRDIYQKLIHKGREISQQRLVWYSRIVVLLIVVIATGLALSGSQLIFWLVLFAWAGLGAALGPAIILALYWKRTTKWGIFAGFGVGTLTTIIWNQTPALKHIIYELVPGFLFATLAIIVVSLFTKAPPTACNDLQAIGSKYKK
ncbi:sodium/proline symporter [candidate division KSB1 bacterium]|nr:sodium/proline symporter [candidate division KSB1 bacterium]